MKRGVPLGPPGGSPALLPVWGRGWLGASVTGNPDGGGVWRHWVGTCSRAGANVRVGKYHVFTQNWDRCVHNFRASDCLVWLCVCVCVCVILEWTMRCKENSYSDFSSNLYMFLYQHNLLRPFIFKIQKCLKVLTN